MTGAERVLVAGIGNVFLGDDGFGVEVAQRLAARAQPDGVRIADFGIRGFDLAYAMLDEREATILVDAMPRGQAPGTVSLVEADVADEEGAPTQASFQGHAMTPQAVFALVRAMGGSPRRVFVVGCEPLTFGPEHEGHMGLSDTVAAAVDEAVSTVERLVGELVAEPAAQDRPERA